jgi:hypothetical protein
MFFNNLLSAVKKRQQNKGILILQGAVDIRMDSVNQNDPEQIQRNLQFFNNVFDPCSVQAGTVFLFEAAG